MASNRFDLFLAAGVLACLVTATGQSAVAEDVGYMVADDSVNTSGECECDPDGYYCREPNIGFIAPSDPDYWNFISPMTNPVFFEDPRTLTEARLIFLNHTTPPALGSDTVRLLAMQVRVALTDRLSIIATKDGFIMTDSNLFKDGWADVAAGLKYNLWKDADLQRILSVGATYEMPFGSTRTLQGNGDGEFNMFASYGMQVGERGHYVTASGFRLPANRSAENQVFYWSHHVDRQILTDNLYLFGEANWYQYMSNGNAFPLPVQGGDLFNLGSVGIAGTSEVTAAFGLKYKPSLKNELGIAYELPCTQRNGLINNRLTVDLILRY